MLEGTLKDAESPKADDSASSNSSRAYTFVDLFAGCGGLSLGLEQAGFTPVFVNELNRHAMDTYLANRGHVLQGEFAANMDLRCNDINDLADASRVEKLKSDLSNLSEMCLEFNAENKQSRAGGGSNLDLVVGGPPCQGFSRIGIRRSYAVDRESVPSNRLYERMADVIDQLRPRMFLFENVNGLRSARWTRDGTEKVWHSVLEKFDSIDGYEIDFEVVQSSKYGVPQNRPRVLLVGIRKDILKHKRALKLDPEQGHAIENGFLPAGSGKGRDCPPDLENLLGDLVDPKIEDTLQAVAGGDQYPKEPFESREYAIPFNQASELQKSFRKAPAFWRSTEVPLTEQVYTRHASHIITKFFMMEPGGSIPGVFATKKFSQRKLPVRWDNAGPTITATSLPDDYVHFKQPRILTVREWARLQQFPDWYVFKGPRTTGGLKRAGNPKAGNYERVLPRYTQIGNAVPVGLAHRVGEYFKTILDEAIG